MKIAPERSSSFNKMGFGTAAIGRPQYINIRKKKTAPFVQDQFRRAGLQMLEKAYQSGIRYFDTAPGYGMAEALMIEWLASKNDPQIEIATKWGYTYTADFDPSATIHEVKEHSLQKLREQWVQSKELLPALSTYQIHSATFETGVLENQAVLEHLDHLKRTHHLKIGFSTSGANHLEILRKGLEVEVNGSPLFEVFQVTYNILDQEVAQLAESIQAQGGRLIIKEALANARLLPFSGYQNYQELYQLMQSMAQKYGVGSDAIALRFCMDSINPFKVLSGASNAQQLASNLQAGSFKLEPSEIEALKHFRSTPAHYWSERKQLNWN